MAAPSAAESSARAYGLLPVPAAWTQASPELAALCSDDAAWAQYAALRGGGDGESGEGVPGAGAWARRAIVAACVDALEGEGVPAPLAAVLLSGLHITACRGSFWPHGEELNRLSVTVRLYCPYAIPACLEASSEYVRILGSETLDMEVSLAWRPLLLLPAAGAEGAAEAAGRAAAPPPPWRQLATSRFLQPPPTGCDALDRACSMEVQDTWTDGLSPAAVREIRGALFPGAPAGDALPSDWALLRLLLTALGALDVLTPNRRGYLMDLGHSWCARARAARCQLRRVPPPPTRVRSTRVRCAARPQPLLLVPSSRTPTLPLLPAAAAAAALTVPLLLGAARCRRRRRSPTSADLQRMRDDGTLGPGDDEDGVEDVGWLEHAARGAAGARRPVDAHYAPYDVAKGKAEWGENMLDVRADRDVHGDGSLDEGVSGATLWDDLAQRRITLAPIPRGGGRRRGGGGLW
jgi:hypothetical protein